MSSAKESPFLNFGFNIILPVIILNKGQSFISSPSAPVWTLLIALSFPFLYGLKDFIILKKINAISLIGLVSIALTGGLALLRLEGIYFALKEAGIPLALALIALASVFLKKPLARLLIFKSSLFDTDLIKARLKSNNKEREFAALMNLSTLALAGSFVLSSGLNFVIALLVFADIDPLMEEAQKRQIINEQVADMTWMGYVFIALPLTLVTGALLFWILKQLKILTGLSLGELVPQAQKRS